MSHTFMHMNGWREILARIFAGFTAQDNVSPPWLVNPATRRRLKLDCLYPEAGIAVRFVGLTAKGQGRQSDWEVQDSEQRDETRQELCRLNDIQLILIDPLDDPVKQLDGLIRLMGRASRVLAQGGRPAAEKQQWMPVLSQARERAGQLRTVVARNPDQAMTTLAERWRDREAGLASELQQASQVGGLAVGRPSGSPPAFRSGQRVEHTRFGKGIVTQIEGEGAETRVSVLFDADQERTFLAALLADKLVTEGAA